MATKEVGWAPSNPWFKEGFKYLDAYQLDKNTEIQIMPLAYFLAAKFVAFHDRGKDPRTSHDLEDIIFVLDNCIDLAGQILKSSEDVKDYLKSEFTNLLSQDMEEAVLGHLNPFTQKERFDLMKAKLNRIIKTID